MVEIADESAGSADLAPVEGVRFLIAPTNNFDISSVVEFSISKLNLQRLPVMNGVELTTDSPTARQFANVLRMLPGEMSALRFSLLEVIYGMDKDCSPEVALARLSADFSRLKQSMLKAGYQLYPQRTHLGPYEYESRYSLQGVTDRSRANGFQKANYDPQDLVQRAAQRDVEAFAELYDEHKNAVYRFIFFKVGDPTLAEDLTATVFGKAWENINRFQWRNLPFQHWLIKIGRNVVVDHWRANRRQIGSIDGLFDVASAEVPPDERVAHALEVDALRQALSALPEDQREVLILRFIEQYSHADVAAVLGKSVVAVRQIQVRGLRALRKLMSEESDESGPKRPRESEKSSSRRPSWD